MKKSALPEMDNDSLIERYVELSVQQGDAGDILDVAKANRLMEKIHAIGEELRRRPGDQRRVLMRLFKHPNAQVRLNAACNLISIIPKEARQQIEAIAESKVYPIAGLAGTYLLMLDGPSSSN